MKNEKIKSRGAVFTPQAIVIDMLKIANYNGRSILNKKVLEPSFGKGVFLKEILERIITVSAEEELTLIETIEQIENNIYGFEIDSLFYESTIKSLDDIVKMRLGPNVVINWNLYNINTLLEISELKKRIENLNNGFDFIIGNPPYIKVHNFDDEIALQFSKNSTFCKGQTDMYVMFFEQCLNLLKKEGVLCFITPNSYFKNKSQKIFREYLVENNLIDSIHDYGGTMAFEGFSTYAAITVLRKVETSKKSQICSFYYHRMNSKDHSYICTIDNKTSTWLFLEEGDRKIIEKNEAKKFFISDIIQVQNGISTNFDKAYIDLNPIRLDDNLTMFNGVEIESAILKKIVKGSTKDWGSIIFPYTFNSETKEFVLMSEDILSEFYPKAYAYLLTYKDDLLNRNMESRQKAQWYQFARSQGLKNSKNIKIVLGLFVPGDKTADELKEKPNAIIIDEDSFVYSGLLLTLKDELPSELQSRYTQKQLLRIVTNALNSNDFLTHCRVVGKPMQHGFSNINTNTVKTFKLL